MGVIITYDELDACSRIIEDFYSEHIPELGDGTRGIPEHVALRALLNDRLIDRSFFFSPDVAEFAPVLHQVWGEDPFSLYDPQDTVDHERQHGEMASSYGFNPMYCLALGRRDWKQTVAPFILYDVSSARSWDVLTYLEALAAITDAPTRLSSGDARHLRAIRSAIKTYESL